MAFGDLGDLGGHFRLGAVGQTSRLHVGAGDVDLYHVHSGGGQLGAHFAVLLGSVARDVGDDGKTLSLEPGQLLGDESVHAGVLKPHRIQHPQRGLGDTGGGIAVAGQGGQALDGDAPQTGDIKKFPVLPAEAKGAGGHGDGVFQVHPGQLYSHISHSRPPPQR